LISIREADLVAGADVDELAAKRAVEEFGFERPYMDYHRMLAEEDLQGVIVVTPHHILKDAALAAIQSGVHVFIEKPMAMNQEEGQVLVDAAKTADVTVMVGYTQRFSESRRTMKSLIGRGAVGNILTVNAIKCGWPLTGWPADPTKGGGPLRYLGVHITDQILWMLGDKAERVYAEIVWNQTTGAEQSCTYTIRFKSGVLVNVLCSQNSEQIDHLEIIGTDGRISTDWPADVIQLQSKVIDEYRYPTTIRPEGDLRPATYRDEMQAWIDSLLEHRQPPITGVDGIRVLEIIDAAFKSAQTAMPVTLR